MSKKWFITLIVLGILVAGVISVGALFVTSNNKAINLEEQIHESGSAIEVQEKRRVDLILNLVDTVESYNLHESETLSKLTEARSKASNGNVEEAQVTLNAVTEAYPELKSQANYQQLMTELSTTENLIAQHRDNFNIQVKAYNKHVRKFPNNIILGIMGYEKIEADYLEYDTSSDAPTDLFKEE